MYIVILHVLKYRQTIFTTAESEDISSPLEQRDSLRCFQIL